MNSQVYDDAGVLVSFKYGGIWVDVCSFCGKAYMRGWDHDCPFYPSPAPLETIRELPIAISTGSG